MRSQDEAITERERKIEILTQLGMLLEFAEAIADDIPEIHIDSSEEDEWSLEGGL